MRQLSAWPAAAYLLSASQLVHDAAPAFENVPALHVVILLPPSHFPPAGHVAHDVRVALVPPLVYEPGAHTWQLSALPAAANLLSAPQLVQDDAPAFENVPAMVISPDAPNGHLQGHRSSSSKRTPSKPGLGQATPGGGGRGKQQRERGSVSGGGLRRVPSDSNAVSSPGNSFNEGNKERPGITRKTSASKGGSFKGKGRQQGAKQM